MDEAVQGEDSPRLDDLAAAYIRIRDARADLKRTYEEQDEELSNQMSVIAEEMLGVCKELGADSIKTKAGTIIRSVKSRYWTNDWDSMYRFIKENDAFPLLEKRLHQTHMKEFLSENPDLLPAGLNVESEYTVVVRRSK
ncbi:hypothetical protein EBT31_11430 [bacterium]|jgi:hypothetical protein|nr:hypothetical protein [bacterium]